jgi:hypothetical protein
MHSQKINSPNKTSEDLLYVPTKFGVNRPKKSIHTRCMDGARYMDIKRKYVALVTFDNLYVFTKCGDSLKNKQTHNHALVCAVRE